MRTVSPLALVASLLTATEALNFFGTPNRRQSSGVVLLSTNRKRSSFSPSERDQLRFRKRAGYIQETLDNEDTLYFADVQLGTPGQSLRLDIDTGSSDLWTNSATSQLCVRYSQQCAQSGTYTANSSSTYKYVNSDFYIKYADGSYALGDYGTDTLSIGGTSVQNLQFGIGYNSTSAQGILGVGYASNEASISTTGKTYANLPQLLQQQGITNTMAYSLWLNDLDASTGSILFGGVDTAKYHGTLVSLPIIKEQGYYREFIIALNGVTAAGTSIFSDSPIAVLLDSGSSLSYLPNTYASSLFNVFSASYDSNSGAATVSCNLMSSTKTVDFAFSGVTISVPMNELVMVDGYRRGQPICILGISAAGDSTAVLGDTFLRSAYVVYDLSNNEISLASTNFNATSSSIKAITSGVNGVPGASSASSAVTTLAVTSGGAIIGGPGTVTGSASSKAQAVKTPAPIAYGKVAAVAAAGLAFAL